MTIERFKALQLDKNFMPMTLDEMRRLEPVGFKAAFADDLAVIKKRGVITAETQYGIKTFSQAQLNAKFKHAVDFGMNTAQKNSETMVAYQQAVVEHLNDYHTRPYGQYRQMGDSVVYYNPITMIAAVFNQDGEFVTAFRIQPSDRSNQYKHYIEKGILF